MALSGSLPVRACARHEDGEQQQKLWTQVQSKQEKSRHLRWWWIGALKRTDARAWTAREGALRTDMRASSIPSSAASASERKLDRRCRSPSVQLRL